MRGESANTEVLFLAWSPKSYSVVPSAVGWNDCPVQGCWGQPDHLHLWKTGTLTGRHHKNRNYFIVRINPGTKKVGFSNDALWLKGIRSDFQKDWLSLNLTFWTLKQTLTEGTLLPASLARLVLTMCARPRDGSCIGSCGSLGADYTSETHCGGCLGLPTAKSLLF